MDDKDVPAIVDVEVLDDAAVITFSDGVRARFSAELLHCYLHQAQQVSAAPGAAKAHMLEQSAPRRSSV